MKYDTNVDKPIHYTKHRLETIENIRNSMTHEEYVGYLKGNIKKYIDRYQDKGGIEDIKKARKYLDWLLDVESDET